VGAGEGPDFDPPSISQMRALRHSLGVTRYPAVAGTGTKDAIIAKFTRATAGLTAHSTKNPRVSAPSRLLHRCAALLDPAMTA